MPPSPTLAADLYLDLLKRTLTGTVYTDEPNQATASEARYIHQFATHYIRGQAISMLPLARLDNLQSCIADIVAAGVPGDLIETGVWRGGATIFMRAMLKVLGVTDRTVWVADSFEGLPEPDAEKHPIEAKAHHGATLSRVYNHFAVGIEEVQRNFRAYGMLDGQVRFLKGWFKDTLAQAPIGRLALMRLDGDYYQSTMDALTGLWDRLSIGGYVIIDDYGEDRWTNCRQAVEEFRQARGITDAMTPVDAKCQFWRRSR